MIASIICVLCVLVMAASLWFGGKQDTTFTPPPFDAQTGMPEVPEELGWGKIYQDGMGFSVYVSGKPQLDTDGLLVYLTNPSENDVWIKLRILDDANEVLGESGLIKPGEYITSIDLEKPARNNVKLKVMAYEPETYHSAGSIILNTMLSPT